MPPCQRLPGALASRSCPGLAPMAIAGRQVCSLHNAQTGFSETPRARLLPRLSGSLGGTLHLQGAVTVGLLLGVYCKMLKLGSTRMPC